MKIVLIIKYRHVRSLKWRVPVAICLILTRWVADPLSDALILWKIIIPVGLSPIKAAGRLLGPDLLSTNTIATLPHGYPFTNGLLPTQSAFCWHLSMRLESTFLSASWRLSVPGLASLAHSWSPYYCKLCSLNSLQTRRRSHLHKE